MDFKKYAIGLDVGGTNIRAALVSNDGVLVDGGLYTNTINQFGTKEELAQSIIAPVVYLKKKFPVLDVVGIGIGMPGTPDPEGCSIKDGNKFSKKLKGVAGLNLKNVLNQTATWTHSLPIKMENDANVFIKGEAWRGAARDFQRVLGITMGTGMGIAFLEDNQIIKERFDVPKNGQIWDTSLLDSRWLGPKIFQQPVVKGNIMLIYRLLKFFRGGKADVKDIAERALNGERAAVCTFKICDLFLALMLKSILKKFRPETIVFGGQIAKSFSLFNKCTLKIAEKYRFSAVVSQNIDTAPLIGAASLIFNP